MLGPCARTSVLLLPLMTVALWAAPLTKYDQRQEGELNVHAHLENFVILLIPGGLRNLNIAAKVAPGRGHDRKHARPGSGAGRLPSHASVSTADAPTVHGHGLKVPPYHVDIDAERQGPIVLEITGSRVPEQEHQDEVVIAESPAVVLTKKPLESELKPKNPATEEVPASQESTVAPLAEEAAVQSQDEEHKPSALTPNKIPSKLAENPNKPALANPEPATPTQDPAPIGAPEPAQPPAPARTPSAAPATASVEKPKRPIATIVEKPKRPVSSVAAEKPRKPVAIPAAAAVEDAPVAATEKPKRPAAATLAAAAAATAAEEETTAPVAESKPSPASEEPAPAPAAPTASAAPVLAAALIPSTTPAAPAAPTAQAQETRARQLAAGLKPHAAAGTPCAQGTCMRDVEPVRESKSYEDSSFMRALQFGLEPAQ